MPRPKEDEIQTATEQLGALFANLPNPTPKERREIAAQISEHGKHLRELEAIRLKAAMTNQSILNTVLCVALAFCFALLLISDDPLKTQGSFTITGAILSGWFSYLAGKRSA